MVRTQPHSLEAEQGLLGSVLLAPEMVLEACSDRLAPEFFFIPAHRQIYGEVVAMHDAHQRIDLITLTQWLRDKGGLDEVGGAPALTSLQTVVPTAAGWEYYLDIVRAKYIRRMIITAGTELVRRAYEDGNDEAAILDKAQEMVTSLALETLAKPTLRHVKEGVLNTLEKLERAYEHRGDQSVTGLATGFHDLDRMTGGLKGQQLLVVAARPSQGKSALAMNIAEAIALGNKDQPGVPVAVFSMEMSYEELSDRLTCAHTRISLDRLRDGFLAEGDFTKLHAGVSRLASASIYIDDSRSLWISDFKARARRAATRLGVKCIVVDYLQLMSSPSRRAQDNRVLEITEISGGLKSIAKELNIPIVVAAQLNREAEKRAFGRPKLSDLRESGSIENDADMVMLLWRPERHCQNDDHREACAKVLKLHEKEDAEGRPIPLADYAMLIIEKHRNGPVGEIDLRYTGDLTRFDGTTAKMWSNNPAQRQGHKRPQGEALGNAGKQEEEF